MSTECEPRIAQHMEMMTFISNMTSALAWPVVVGAIFLHFRHEIKGLARTLKKLKVGSLEAERFEEKAQATVILADAVSLPSDDRVKQIREAAKQRAAIAVQATMTENDDTLAATAETSAAESENAKLSSKLPAQWRPSPIAVIRAHWEAIESALQELIRKRVGSKAIGHSLRDNTWHLFDIGILDDTTFTLIRNLMDLANSAAHKHFKPTPEAVHDFVAASEKATLLIRRLAE